MKKILIILVVLVAGSLIAETLTVKMFIGKVSYRRANETKWFPVKMNITLDSQNILKVYKNSEVTLANEAGASIRLTKEDTYEITKLLSQFSAKENEQTSVVKVIGSKLLKLSKETKHNLMAPTAVAGVRGADVSQQKSSVKASELYWAE